MSDYIIRIQTDKDLGSEKFVRGLLSGWFREVDENLRPEFFDLGEPVRRSFAAEGVDAAIHTWLSNGMSLYLRRRSKPKFLAATEWFRREKGRDPRLFPWSVTIWLSPLAGDGATSDLLRFLIRHFEPAFGLITTKRDYQGKHFPTFEDIDGTTEKYLGQDILEKDQRLPGVYWTTYFGPWAVDRIGGSHFANLGSNVEEIDGGYLTRAYLSSSEAGSPSAQEKENQLATQLGKNHFFDKAMVNIDALRTDAETAEMVEEKIMQMKRQGSGND